MKISKGYEVRTFSDVGVGQRHSVWHRLRQAEKQESTRAEKVSFSGVR